MGYSPSWVVRFGTCERHGHRLIVFANYTKSSNEMLSAFKISIICIEKYFFFFFLGALRLR